MFKLSFKKADIFTCFCEISCTKSLNPEICKYFVRTKLNLETSYFNDDGWTIDRAFVKVVNRFFRR